MRNTIWSALAVALLGLLGSPVPGQEVVRPGVKVQAAPLLSLPNLLLVDDKGVQKELRITKEQGEKINGFADRQRMVFQNSKGDPKGLQKYQQEMTDLKKEVDAILTPAQAKRLRQLELQQRGGMVFFDPQVAKDLGLTIQQRQQVGMSMHVQFQKLAQSLQDLKGNVEEINKKLAEMQKNALEEAVKLLTPEQQRKWKEMAGEPYKGTLPTGYGGGPILLPAPFPNRETQIRPNPKPRD